MNVLALWAGLALFQPTPVDSVAVYTAILRQVQSEYPGRPVVLAETRSGVRCMPTCGADLRDPGGSPAHMDSVPEADHSPALLGAMRDRGLINATCAVQEMSYGCDGFPGYLFVALGEITRAPRPGPSPVDGGVWVQTAFLIPCRPSSKPNSSLSCHPEMFGYWYLVLRGSDGTWTVARRAPNFTAA